MIRKLLLIIAITTLKINVVMASEKNTELFTHILPFASLSNAIYADLKAVKRVASENDLKFERLETIPGVEITYAILKQPSKNRKIIVIRGTANTENAAVDMDFKLVPDELSGISIHQGFKDASTPIFKQLQTVLSKDEMIITTGHSLGGAAALVLAMQLQAQGFKIDRVITFGQPKVTNITGSNKFSDLNVVRVVVPKDPVPVVPPLDPIDINNINIYWHVGKEIVLLGNNKFAVLEGIKAMMRGGEFLTIVPDQSNIESHFMQTYLTEIKNNTTKVSQTDYKLSVNFGRLLGFDK